MVVAFDRDGCLIGSPFDFKGNHPGKLRIPGDQVINPVVSEFVRSLPSPIIVISNQAGCYWGYKGEAGVIAEMRWLMRRLPIARAYFCPCKDGRRAVWCTPTYWGEVNQVTHPGWNFRKPANGMAKLAREHGFPLTQYVGDMSGCLEYGYGGRDSDRKFAVASGLEFIPAQSLAA